MGNHVVGELARQERRQQEATTKALADLEARFEAKLQAHLLASNQHVDAVVMRALQPLPQELRGVVREELTKSLAGNHMREPLLQAFRASFQELIIPSFQASTQRMFEQISSALTEGLKDVPAAAAAASRRPPVRGTNPRGPAPAETVSPEEEIAAVLEEQRFDEAMMMALGAKDLALVTWLCKRLDCKVLFAAEPVPLSQAVCLCLLQQLGADLSTDTPMKLEWMKEIALNLEKNHVTVKAFVVPVLFELQQSMRAFAATDAGRLHNTELRLLMRVL